MLAWFGQELAQQPFNKQQHSKAAAAEANSPLQSVTAGLGVPLATAGLQAAAAATSIPAAVSTGSGDEAEAADAGGLSGPRLAAVFEEWVKAADLQADVEFRVKA
jgi:hypothetical protein